VLEEIAPKDTQNLEGRLKSVACGDNGQGGEIVLDKNGAGMTFHRKGEYVVGFSDTLWFGSDHFTICHHLENLRTIVRYRASADQSYAGDVVEIEIRDDLPAALTP
jgi:hypothetical protein